MRTLGKIWKKKGGVSNQWHIQNSFGQTSANKKPMKMPPLFVPSIEIFKIYASRYSENAVPICLFLDFFVKHFPNYLELMSAIFHQIFIFSPNDSPSKTMKCFFISSKKLFLFLKYSNFCKFFLSFPHFQIQKDKWKWNDLWCHELACINL